jgi:phasin
MPTPSYEVPSDMRDMAEKSVDQARRAFDGFMSAAQKAVGQADTTTASMQSNAKTIGSKAMGFAESNVRSAFDLAQKLVRAKDIQEVLALQSDYAKSQLTTIQEQAKEIGSLMQSGAQGVVQSTSQTVKAAADEAMNRSNG